MAVNRPQLILANLINKYCRPQISGYGVLRCFAYSEFPLQTFERSQNAAECLECRIRATLGSNTVIFVYRNWRRRDLNRQGTLLEQKECSLRDSKQIVAMINRVLYNESSYYEQRPLWCYTGLHWQSVEFAIPATTNSLKSYQFLCEITHELQFLCIRYS